MDDTPIPVRSRANRIGLIFAGLVVVALVAMSYLAWWHARALTHEELERAVNSEPADREAFFDRLGPFTQHQVYATADLGSTWREAFLEHPHYHGSHRWYDGRGGQGAVSTAFLISSVSRPADHPTDHTLEAPPDQRDFCIFLDVNSRVVGWLEVTGGPTVFELAEWQQSQPTAAK